MATYDFRVLLETVDGAKTSYYSSSFVDTSTDLVLSASQVWARITGSVSCSYQNSYFFSQSAEPTTNDINTSYVFKDNNLLSASLSGSLDRGLIEFKSLNTEYDRLLRYKFIGEKVCSTIGLPENQWIYVDQFRLAADDESNYFEGNVNAKNAYISNTLTFANNSTINTDVPFSINTGSDRHIKFIDQRESGDIGLFMGYDKDLDTYEIGGSKNVNKSFFITDVNKLEANEISHSSHTYASPVGVRLAHELTIGGNTPALKMIEFGETDDSGLNPDMQIYFNVGKLIIANLTNSDNGDIEIRTQGFTDAIYIKNSVDSVGIGTDSPEATLHVAGDLKVDGGMQVIGAITSSIVSSSIMFSSGSNIFGDDITDTQTFNGHITASGNISSSGGESTFGQVVNLEGTDPRLRLKAKGANHPGVEWYEDSTRKWVVYNDPDESDKLVFKNDSTELLKLTQAGNLGVTEEIYHIEDTDTKITFTADDINITVGGMNMVDFTEGSTDEITFNESAQQLDVRIESEADPNLFFTDGTQNKVGIGTKTPGSKLTVAGDISGSGNVYAKTFKSERVIAYIATATDGEEYYFSIGPAYLQSTYNHGDVDPETPMVQTAMCNLSIKRLKIQLGTLALNNIGSGFKIYCRKWNGSGNIDSNANWVNVGTAWTVASSNQAAYTRFYHAPSDWNIDAGDVWSMQFEANGSGTTNVYFNGAIIIEEDWNNMVSS